jgi:hypothetical protein
MGTCGLVKVSVWQQSSGHNERNQDTYDLENCEIPEDAHCTWYYSPQQVHTCLCGSHHCLTIRWGRRRSGRWRTMSLVT